MNAPLFNIRSKYMSNINKILITVVICVFMICVASVSIVSIVTSNKSETDTAVTTTTTAPASQYEETQSTTQAAPTSVYTETSAVTTTTAPATTTAPVTSVPASEGLETAILGKWTDSSGLSGYEFLEGGKVNWTYANLGQFGVPFDGYATGLYSLEGDTLTVKFSIYTATIKKTYRASVNGNELSMYDLEEHETSTYARVS